MGKEDEKKAGRGQAGRGGMMGRDKGFYFLAGIFLKALCHGI